MGPRISRMALPTLARCGVRGCGSVAPCTCGCSVASWAGRWSKGRGALSLAKLVGRALFGGGVVEVALGAFGCGHQCECESVARRVWAAALACLRHRPTREWFLFSDVGVGSCASLGVLRRCAAFGALTSCDRQARFGRGVSAFLCYLNNKVFCNRSTVDGTWVLRGRGRSAHGAQRRGVCVTGASTIWPQISNSSSAACSGVVDGGYRGEFPGASLRGNHCPQGPRRGAAFIFNPDVAQRSLERVWQVALMGAPWV